MKWFGESWHAPICDPSEHVERPRGRCMYCDVKLKDGDSGVAMPTILELGESAIWLFAHRDCFFRALGVPVAVDDVVHILSLGRVACGFSDKVPSEWPPGHKWVSFLDWKETTCPECLKRAPQDPEWETVIAERAKGERK